jgi:hypothetical protein
MIKIGAFITGCNQRSHPFIWTKPADHILDKINRKLNRTSERWDATRIPPPGGPRQVKR